MEGNYSVPDSEIINYTHLKIDSINKIEDINLKLIEDRILRNKEIKKVTAEIIPPSTIKLTVSEKNPVAVVNLEKELKLVDESLEIIPITNEEKIYDLPILNGIMNLGEIKKDDLKLGVFIIVSIIKKSRYLQTLISEVNLSDSNNIVLYSNENGLPFILPRIKGKTNIDSIYQNEIYLRLSTLKKFFEYVYSEEKKNDISYVDLRFPSQVIIKYN